MNKNYIFREFECGLSVEETAELCLKTARTVKEWDKGKAIPPECKRLMRLTKGRELHISEEWEQFRMTGNKLQLPTGKLVTPQQVLIGIALVEIQSELEIKVTTKIIKYAREIARIKGL